MDSTFGLVVSLGIWTKPKANEQAATQNQPRRVSGAKQNKQYAPALTLAAAHRQPPPPGHRQGTPQLQRHTHRGATTGRNQAGGNIISDDKKAPGRAGRAEPRSLAPAKKCTDRPGNHVNTREESRCDKCDGVNCMDVVPAAQRSSWSSFLKACVFFAHK